MRECYCGKDKLDLLRLIKSIISYINKEINKKTNKSFYTNLFKDKPKHRCIFQKTTIDIIDNIIKCFGSLRKRDNDFLRKNCPDYIICEENRFNELYKLYDGIIAKHPDVLVIKAEKVTLVIEEKRYGKQNFREFEDQIISSFNNLPPELMSPCTFVVYAPLKGGTLPQGFVKHPILNLLAKDLGRRVIIFEIPVLVLERKNLIKYLDVS